MIALLAVLLATVTGNPPPTSYSCTGATTVFAIPWPYLAASHVVVTQTTSGVVTTLTQPAGYSVKPSVAPSAGTATLAVACPSGSTLTISRNVPRTQPQSFRTGSYQGPDHETAFDRLEMQIQQSIMANTPATISSLTLTTPLPLASGGTGIALGSCGAGFLTSDGTKLVCQIPSGLAAPGTTGVVLQATSPGSFQTGSINIRGNMIVGGVSQGDPVAQLGAATSTGGIYFGGIQGGALKPLASARGGLGIYPSDFNNGITNASGTSFSIFGSTNASALITGSWVTAAGLGNGGGIISESWAQCNNLNPCVGASGTAFILGAQTGKPVTVDSAASVASGDLFAVNNLATKKFGVDFAGVVTSTGLTSSGPVSGTTLTSSGLATLASATVTGVSTHTGATALNGGVTIGASGTAISKSVRGTATWNPGTVAANGGTATTSITVTGAVTGADCIAGVTSPAPLSGYPVQCIITAADTCGVMIVNQATAGVTFGSATFYCRVFNP
jgi:hypothetical protein